MAKIQEEIVVIKFSRLVKDDTPSDSKVTQDVTTALVQVAEELVGNGVIVEIEKVQ